MITSLYDPIYNGIQKDPNKTKKSYQLHNRGHITLTLPVVKKVKKEKAGIFPKALNPVNSQLASSHLC